MNLSYATISASPMSFLSELNPAQQAAVKAVNGPVMIVAGAGSGKTRVLTYRTAYLLQCGVQPFEILALTFTNKAANEMKSRIIRLVGPRSKNVWMGTFHSMFARILRQEAEKLAYSRNFTIYDTEDGLSLVKRVMNSLGVPAQQFSPKSIRSRISGAKNQLVSPKEYQRLASDLFEEKTAQVYEEYQRLLKMSNAMDFDDLLLNPIALFERYPKVLEKYQERFRHILVDEFQDTNRPQYILIKLLSRKYRNVCVVGDDAQSIYAFRGADIRNILDFEKDYPDYKIFRLEQNYRSTKRILRAADSVIKQNVERIRKELWTENEDGELVMLLVCEDDRDEGYRVVQHIRDESLRQKLDLKDFAVLYRTNAQSRSLEDALRRQGIPYTIVGGVEFYKRKEIKDVLAYLKVIANPSDEETLLRIINYPPRGIGETTIAKLRGFAREGHLSLFDAVTKVSRVVSFSDKTKASVNEFARFLHKYIRLKKEISASELARAVVDELGILHDYKQEGTTESLSRWENVQELLSAITEFTERVPNASLESFLEEVSLLSDVDTWDNQRNSVTLMTVHSAKGLEFPVVFITGLEEGLFPLQAALQDRSEVEEERRLFYVAMTRAMRKVFLSFARRRYRFGESSYQAQSRFIDEIDPSSILAEEVEGRTRHRKLREETDFAFDDDERHQRSKSVTAKKKGLRIVYDEEERGSPSLGTLTAGVTVEHDTFGRGYVLQVYGTGDDAHAVVVFDAHGPKKLLLRYARLRVID
ncbi:MAG: UvrD-helicase domain-containing protein [Bacteroidota bacterium]